jgi:hypothetical protein
MGIKGLNRLNTVQAYMLTRLIETSYVASKQSDGEFAEAATKTLGFKVTISNMRSIRKELKIKANVSVLTPQRRVEGLKKAFAAKRAVQQPEEPLRSVVARMESKVDKLLKAWNIQ